MGLGFGGFRGLGVQARRFRVFQGLEGLGFTVEGSRCSGCCLEGVLCMRPMPDRVCAAGLTS